VQLDTEEQRELLLAILDLVPIEGTRKQVAQMLSKLDGLHEDIIKASLAACTDGADGANE
jgi:hypothetical protein